MIISAGYACFTRASGGSVFIRHLVDMLATHSGTEDIFTMLTWVTASFSYFIDRVSLKLLTLFNNQLYE